MAYRRFKLPEMPQAAATDAKHATVRPPEPGSVADVANVAAPEQKPETSVFRENVASVASIAAAPIEWDQLDWRAFFDERAGIAEFDGGLTRVEAETLAFACCVIEWSNRNPQTSSPDACLACLVADSRGDPLVPFCVSDHGRAWLHPRCWDAWHKARQAKAKAALVAMGIGEACNLSDDFGKNGGV